MRKKSKILSKVILAAIVLSSMLTVFSFGGSAEVVAIFDNKEAQVIEATAEGVSVTFNWISGYITAPNRNGVKAFYRCENNQCYFTDVFVVKDAGTEITFTDPDTFLSNEGYVISSWIKDADGYWVGDPDGASYYGMERFTSRVQSKNANGGIDYKYITSKENEAIRICYRLGSNESACPQIKFKLTGEKGTFAKELEDEVAEVFFNSNGTVENIFWTCGYIGSAMNTNGYAGAVNPSSQNFAFSSIVKVEKAGTTISFTDASGNAYAQNNAYVISLWKKEDNRNRYYIDETKTHYAGNNGKDNEIKVGGKTVFAEKKNTDGSVTYTYVTQSDNENLRFCYHTGCGFDTVPTQAAVVTWDSESEDVGGNVFDADQVFIKGTYVSTSNGLQLPYRLYIPTTYDPQKSYPLILFLHGAGERGNDNAAQLKNGILIPFSDPDSPIHECIVVAPQCPTEYKWVEVSSWKNCRYSTEDIDESLPLAAAYELLTVIKTDYSVDANCIYATGISMGGYGTWDLLARHGDTFAAVIPVCGGVDISHANAFKNIPIYTFHGLKDTTVPPDGTLSVVDLIRILGGDKITLVTYPEGTHIIWDTAYGTEGLMEWLLSHKLSDRAVEDPSNNTAKPPVGDMTDKGDGANTTPVETDAVEDEPTTADSDTVPTGKTKSGCSHFSFPSFASAIVGMVSIFGFAIIKKP